MCPKCIFRVEEYPNSFPAYVLLYREHVIGWDRNQFQQAERHLCEHDQERFDLVCRYVKENSVTIPDFLVLTLAKGTLFVPWMDLLVHYGKGFHTPDYSSGIEFGDESLENCYGMAYQASSYWPAMQYAEGLCWRFPDDIGRPPLWHVWNIHPISGGVYDLTWPMSHWNEYFGIVFDLQWVKENCKMECGIFHPANWPYNEDPVRHYLQSR